MLYPYRAESGPVEVTDLDSTGNAVNYIVSIEPKRLTYLSESHPIQVMIPNPSGALYWIILKLYQGLRENKAEGEPCYYSTIAHFIGDLSNPLHNFPHGDEIAGDGKYYQKEGTWATEIIDQDGKRDRHSYFDRAYENSFTEKVIFLESDRFKIDYVCNSLNDETAFETGTNSVHIATVDDLKQEISRVANSSIGLAETCYRSNRNMTEREAFRQLLLSVSLLKAVKESIDAIH
jgi:hypothetical protein